MVKTNILRIIKLNELNGKFENLTPEEYLFFKLHENLHENSNGELCDENGAWLINYDFNNNHLWYSYERFYLVFTTKFDICIQEFNNLCESILYKYLNCIELTPIQWTDKTYRYWQ